MSSKKKNEDIKFVEFLKKDEEKILKYLSKRKTPASKEFIAKNINLTIKQTERKLRNLEADHRINSMISRESGKRSWFITENGLNALELVKLAKSMKPKRK